jgi:hypothetical protein
MSQKLVCNCNGTMPLDAKALGVPVHRSLCRQEVGSFLKALDGSDALVVACTQEGARFNELAEQSEKPLVAPLRFVNIREVAGWTQEAKTSGPKIAALLALAETWKGGRLNYTNVYEMLLALNFVLALFIFIGHFYYDISDGSFKEFFTLHMFFIRRNISKHFDLFVVTILIYNSQTSNTKKKTIY